MRPCTNFLLKRQADDGQHSVGLSNWLGFYVKQSSFFFFFFLFAKASFTEVCFSESLSTTYTHTLVTLNHLCFKTFKFNMYEYLPVCVDVYLMCAVLAQDTTRPSSQHKGLLFASEGYWMGDRRQGERGREQGRWARGIFSKGDRCGT